MKNIKILLLIFTITFSFNNNIYSDILTHPPEAFMDLSGWGSSQYNDFYPCTMVYGGWVRYFIKAEYGYVIEKYTNGVWKPVADVIEETITTPETNGVWTGFDQLFYPSQHIAYAGNGDFRLSCYVIATGHLGAFVKDQTPWSYTTITDVVAPSTPGSFNGTWVSNHPYISWSSVIQDDLEEYVIYKKVDSDNWTEFATTTATSYTDNTEDPYVLGSGDKRFVYYHVTARDYTANESVATAQEMFTCDPWLNKTNPELVESEDPFTYTLSANYPNPFNPTTQISYQLEKNSFVNLVVYNSLGQAIAQLVNQRQSSGQYSVQFNAANLPSGVYIYKIVAGEFSATKKMLLTK